MAESTSRESNVLAEKHRESNVMNIGSLTVNIDVSEALVGLKAIQREAKKATQALRELEAAQSSAEFDEEYRRVSDRIAEARCSMRGGVRR